MRVGGVGPQPPAHISLPQRVCSCPGNRCCFRHVPDPALSVSTDGDTCADAGDGDGRLRFDDVGGCCLVVPALPGARPREACLSTGSVGDPRPVRRRVVLVHQVSVFVVWCSPVLSSPAAVSQLRQARTGPASVDSRRDPQCLRPVPGQALSTSMSGSDNGVDGDGEASADPADAGLVELRDYQQAAVEEIDVLWPSTRSIVLQMVTGAGKTITAAAWIRKVLDRNPDTVIGWMVHTGYLRGQAAEAFELYGVPWVDWTEVRPAQRRWVPGRVHCFGSTMSLPPGPYRSKTFLVFDECHRSASETCAKEMDRRVGRNRRRVWRRVLGLSGTPARYGWPDTVSDSQKLFAKQWAAMVCGPSPAELVEAGHLADVAVMSIGEAGGDWELLVPDPMRPSGFSQASERNWERTLSVDAAVAVVKKMPPRPTIWFCASVSAAAQVQKLLARSSATILAGTSNDTRRSLLDAFSAGGLGHLITVRALLEGTDVPVAARIVQLAPSRSRVLLSQAAGRGTRPPGDMELCDFSRSWSHIGAHPLDDVPWRMSLDVSVAVEDVHSATSRARTCPTPGCGTVVSPRTQRLCPSCHFEVVRRCTACWQPMSDDAEDGTHRRCLKCAAAERALHTEWARLHDIAPVPDRDITDDAGGTATIAIGLEALEPLRAGMAVLERQLGQR